MNEQFILTPYFLDEPRPALDRVAGPGWQHNTVDLPPGTTQERMLALHRPLADQVAAAAGRGQRPVSIAGDCCTTIPVLAGLQRAGLDPTLIWFDAHGDFNTWETTPSGFLGGMPLAMLVGRGDQTFVDGAGLAPLAEEKVILTDARDLDPGEREAVAESKVTHLRDVAELLQQDLPPGPLYVHFDVDVMRTDELPAVNYPAAGGPPAATLRAVFRRLAQSGRVAAVSLSSWEPALDREGQGRELCMDLLGHLLGENV